MEILMYKNMNQYLQDTIKEMEEIRGRWDGNEAGYLEEQANIATDIIEKVHELDELINELNGTNF